MDSSAVASTSSLPASVPNDSPFHSSKVSIHTLVLEVETTKPRLHDQVISHLSRQFPRARSLLDTSVRYVCGPQPPQLLAGPEPILNRILPVAVEKKLRHWTRPVSSPYIFAAFAAAYIIALSLFVRQNSFLTPIDSDINCLATYWLPDDGCGLDGQNCLPFTNSTFDFRCPAQCKSVILANQRAVGAEEVEFVPLVIGGGDNQVNGTSGTYRGDSFICAAAIHAGVISDSTGGCATVSLVGTFASFLSSSAGGITSTAFPGSFPLSFRFTPSTDLSNCKDLRNDALNFNIGITVILFLVWRMQPSVLMWSLVCIGYWHITFFSDPRDLPPPISDAFANFLPLLFVAYAIWKVAFRHVLPAFSEAPIERMLLYLPFFWLGVLFNLTLEKIPVDRLLSSDIGKRPGAVVAVVIVSIVVLALVINQVRVIRRTGWLPFYLWRYVLLGFIVLIFSQLPGLEVRLHHYIAAMLLLPLTAFPTRLSAIYQAYCLGMFLDGVARFGFASVLQTPAELRRDAPLGTSLPVWLTNSSTYNKSLPLINQTLFWAPFPDTDEGWNGYSLLIDDVERYFGAAMNFSLAALEPSVPHFFRLAFQKDEVSGDYTRAAVLYPNGTWTDPLPGPS